MDITNQNTKYSFDHSELKRQDSLVCLKLFRSLLEANPKFEG